MTKTTKGTQADKELPLLTSVDDETYDELAALIGERIVHVALWKICWPTCASTPVRQSNQPHLISTFTWKMASTSKCMA